MFGIPVLDIALEIVGIVTVIGIGLWIGGTITVVILFSRKGVANS